MDFADQFERWLKDALRPPIPSDVQVYSFHLYEPEGEKGVRFGVEVIGARRFDPVDPTWARDEVWAPGNRRLSIPQSFSGNAWEGCLAKMRSLVTAAVEKGDAASAVLTARRGVGIGFLDGDMEIVWREPMAQVRERRRERSAGPR